MTAATSSITSVQQPAALYAHPKAAQKPLEVLIGKLLACPCFDATQQQEIKEWMELFSKNFPEMPKDDADKAEAGKELYYLLKTYFQHKGVDHALWVEFKNYFVNYLPTEAAVGDVISAYILEEDFASTILIAQELFEHRMAEYYPRFMAVQSCFEKIFENLHDEMALIQFEYAVQKIPRAQILDTAAVVEKLVIGAIQETVEIFYDERHAPFVLEPRAYRKISLAARVNVKKLIKLGVNPHSCVSRRFYDELDQIQHKISIFSDLSKTGLFLRRRALQNLDNPRHTLDGAIEEIILVQKVFKDIAITTRADKSLAAWRQPIPELPQKQVLHHLHLQKLEEVLKPRKLATKAFEEQRAQKKREEEMALVCAPSAGHSYSLSAASATGIVLVQQSLAAARQSMVSIYAAEDRAQNQALELKRAQMTGLREQNSKLQEQLKANNDAAQKMRADEKAIENALKSEIAALEKSIKDVQAATRNYAALNAQIVEIFNRNAKLITTLNSRGLWTRLAYGFDWVPYCLSK
jgi:hypothetical protein